jgi:hypothetical protein
MKLYLLFLLTAICMMISAYAESPYPDDQDSMQFGVVTCTPIFDINIETATHKGG